MQTYNNVQPQTSLRHTWQCILKMFTRSVCVCLHPRNTHSHTISKPHIPHTETYPHMHTHAHSRPAESVEHRQWCLILRQGHTCTLLCAKQCHSGMTSSPGVEMIGWPPSTGSPVSPADYIAHCFPLTTSGWLLVHRHICMAKFFHLHICMAKLIYTLVWPGLLIFTSAMLAC